MEKPVDYVGSLNSEQLAVVTGGDGACLVLAGAGTGKTRTVSYRVSWLLDHGIDPSSILLVTFTNKAAREMTTRIHELAGSRAHGVFSGTFHSVANRILRKYGAAYGIPSHFSILSSDDAEDLLGLCIKEVRGKSDVKQFPKPGVLNSWISFARNSDLPIDQLLHETQPGMRAFMSDIIEIDRRFAARKRQQHVMDFDDLLIVLRDLLRTHHELRVNLSQQFQYILVDEFQDTNTIQSQLISLLSTQHGNLVVVGDDAQSIYSFRAADIRNILDFPDRNEETKVFKLTHNYRSTPEILALANASIENNADQFDKSLTALQPSGKKPVIIGLPNPAMEAVYVADLVAQAIARGVHAHELAVLFRAAHHSQSLEFELMKRNIPYEYRGGMRFFERAHIKDIIAFARIFTNIEDEMAWIRVLKIFPGIGMATAQKIAHQCMAHDSIPEILISDISAPGRAGGGWQSCLQLLSKLNDNTSRPSSFIRRLIGEKIYQEYVAATYEDARERLDDLEEFAYFSEQSKDLIEFLSIVSLTDDAEVNKETGVGKVILSTVHQAKGLEWDTVFILHACEGSFPHKRTYGDPIALEEERRLFYVAVTRAKKTLTISYPESVGYEHVEYRAPSMFIEELPKDCYDDRTRSFGDALQKSVPRRSFQASYEEEPIIVLDDMGEKKPQKPTPHVMQFLRDLDDL